MSEYDPYFDCLWCGQPIHVCDHKNHFCDEKKKWLGENKDMKKLRYVNAPLNCLYQYVILNGDVPVAYVTEGDHSLFTLYGTNFIRLCWTDTLESALNYMKQHIS